MQSIIVACFWQAQNLFNEHHENKFKMHKNEGKLFHPLHSNYMFTLRLCYLHNFLLYNTGNDSFILLSYYMQHGDC